MDDFYRNYCMPLIDNVRIIYQELWDSEDRQKASETRGTFDYILFGPDILMLDKRTFVLLLHI